MSLPMKRLSPSRALTLIALAAAMTPATKLARAGTLCPDPRPGEPALAFDMTDIPNGACLRQLNRARWLGFTTVTLSPTFYQLADGTIIPSLQSGELERCLDAARETGFDIVYKPLIEEQPKPSSSEPALPYLAPLGSPNETLFDRLVNAGLRHETTRWRADLPVRPDERYRQKLFDPFLKWLEHGRSKLIASDTKASLVVATELNRSVSEHPAKWNRLMHNMQERLRAAKLGDRVQVGIDPSVFGNDSWRPKELTAPLSPSACRELQSMLWTADFYAPSIYGDYLALGFEMDPKGSVQRLLTSRHQSWIKDLASRGCTIDASLLERFQNADYAGRDRGRSTRRTWVGEIGYGGSLERSWTQFRSEPPKFEPADTLLPEKLRRYRNEVFKAEQDDFIRNAPKWFSGVLDAARGSHLDTINLWTTGRFDLFGFSDFPGLGPLESTSKQYSEKDPVRGADQIPAVAQLRDQLQAYAKNRCPGWQPVTPRPAPLKARPMTVPECRPAPAGLLALPVELRTIPEILEDPGLQSRKLELDPRGRGAAER